MQATQTQTKHEVSAREMNEVSGRLRDAGFHVLANDCRKAAVDAAVNAKGVLYVEYGPVLREILRGRGHEGQMQLREIKDQLELNQLEF